MAPQATDHPADPSGISLRELRSEEDYEGCVELQRHTWGESFDELVPAAVIKISQKVGGVAAGAFDATGRQLGFVWGLTGLHAGELTHWSHMLAVHQSARGLGIGKRLKYYQRALLEPLGVRRMLWTYDPLVARNAFLNLVRLGARPVEYCVDMYGEGTGSELHSGLGTDRFVVAWDLRQELGERADEDSDGLHPETPEMRARGDVEGLDAAAELAAGRVLNRSSAISSLPEVDHEKLSVALGAARGARFWVEIPADVEALKKEDRHRALAYRDSLRELLPRLLRRSLQIDQVVRIDAQRVWYGVHHGQSEATGR